MKFIFLLAFCGLVIAFPKKCIAEIIYTTRPPNEWSSVFKLTSDFLPADLPDKRIENFSGIPYAAYNAGLDEIASRKLISVAKLVGFNYLIISKGKLIGSCQLSANSTKIESFQKNTGITADFWKALRLAKKLQATKSKNYHVRYLGCPSILFASLWLHGDSEDIIIPIGKSFGRWTKFKAYSGPEITDILSYEANGILRKNEIEQDVKASN